MKITSDNITFQSGIKFVDTETFMQKTKKLSPKRHKVGYPWTPETMKSGKNLYTNQIMDCIAGGVVEGKKITMFHLCTRSQAAAKRTHQKGFSIKEFGRRLSERIDLTKDNLHAFILGGFQSEPTSKYNVNKLNKIKKFFDDNNIPYTIFGARRDVHYYGRYSMFYESKTDTLYITNSLTSASSMGGGGKQIDIKKNSIEYNTYSKSMTDKGVQYKKNRKETNLEDYLKSQFRQVKLSPLDHYI